MQCNRVHRFSMIRAERQSMATTTRQGAPPTMTMKKMELVFVPPPAIGHLVSHVEFAKRLLDQNDRFSVTVLIIYPIHAPEIRIYVDSLAASDTRLRFINLPQMEFSSTSPTELLEILNYIVSHKLLVKQCLIDHVLLGSVSFAGLVVDILTSPMIDVANELGLSSYLFYISSAACLAAMLSLYSPPDQVGWEFQASETESVIPGYVNPVPNKVLASISFNKTGEHYKFFLNLVRRFKETKAIITNSFVELESHAVKSLLELDNSIPYHMVGPLLDLHGRSSSLCGEAQRDEIMKWLDDQPPSTVVFLCFGSLVLMDEAQALEIAMGLEQSGHRFLWSARIQRPTNDASGKLDNCTNPKEILPREFLERTKGRGLVCGWAPQIEVLAHKSIGGFVSHCGWNSILESLWYGVPILAWPMHGEQQMNAFLMVKDLGLAVEMRLDYKLGESDLVMGDEIEKAIKHLMKGDNEVRMKVKEMSQVSKKAVMDKNGSSFTSYARLIEFMMENAHNYAKETSI